MLMIKVLALTQQKSVLIHKCHKKLLIYDTGTTLIVTIHI